MPIRRSKKYVSAPYTRFRNTLEALEDCANHMGEALDNPLELRARDNMISLCFHMVDGLAWRDGKWAEVA